jgi:hypothetical protein
MASIVTYSPREGVTYSGTYFVKHGMAYVTAQGHTGAPVKIGNLGELDAAKWALVEMVGKFGLEPDSAT